MDRPVAVGDDFLVAIQPAVVPGPLEILPGTVRIDADRLVVIGDRFIKAVQTGATKTRL